MKNHSTATLSEIASRRDFVPSADDLKASLPQGDSCDYVIVNANGEIVMEATFARPDCDHFYKFRMFSGGRWLPSCAGNNGIQAIRADLWNTPPPRLHDLFAALASDMVDSGFFR